MATANTIEWAYIEIDADEDYDDQDGMHRGSWNVLRKWVKVDSSEYIDLLAMDGEVRDPEGKRSIRKVVGRKRRQLPVDYDPIAKKLRPDDPVWPHEWKWQKVRGYVFFLLLVASLYFLLEITGWGQSLSGFSFVLYVIFIPYLTAAFALGFHFWVFKPLYNAAFAPFRVIPSWLRLSQIRRS
jgi:hypothetical protein